MNETPIEQEDVPPAEFHRPVTVAQVSRQKEIRITATESECAALAERFDLLDLSGLEAVMTIKPIAGGRMISLSGEFSADVTQTCAVTLKPVQNNVSETFEMTFGEGREKNSGAGVSDMVISYGEDDPPEPIVDGVIDMGEAVAQHLSVALDPFPRSLEAETVAKAQGITGDDQEEVQKDNPFAVLAKLKEKGN